MSQWNAVVLAGDRGPADPVANIAGVKGKALAKLQGEALIETVVSALAGATSIGRIISVGPDQDVLQQSVQIRQFLLDHQVEILPTEPGPSASALKGVLHAKHYPTLVITCDLPLITSSMIDNYCHRLNNRKEDFIAAAISCSLIEQKLPELKKTQYRFSDGRVCFANLFAVKNPQGVKTLEFWRSFEQSRKKPIELIRKIDWMSVVNYKLGRLSLTQMSSRLSVKIGAHLAVEKFSLPELAIDVDSAEDYQILSKLVIK